MSPKQAEKIISSGKPVTFITRFGEEFTGTPISKDRYNITIRFIYNNKEQTAPFDRQDLQIK